MTFIISVYLPRVDLLLINCSAGSAGGGWIVSNHRTKKSYKVNKYQAMSHEEQDDDLVLTKDDVEEVIEDDGEPGEPMEDDDDVPADAEPMIKDDPDEPRDRPDNAWAGSCT